MRKHIPGLIAMAIFILGIGLLPDVCRLMLAI